MNEADHFPVDPRFLALHEELRHVVLSGIVSLSPSRWPSPEPGPIDPATPTPNTVFDGPSLDFTAVRIPRSRLVRYLQNWVTECAPILDKFDTNRQFQIQVPLIARSSPAVLYAMLTFSSRQMERRGAAEVKGATTVLNCIRRVSGFVSCPSGQGLQCPRGGLHSRRVRTHVVELDRLEAAS